MTVETPAPGLDLDYSIHDFIAGERRDSLFLYDAIERVMVNIASEERGGRALDVACGTGKLCMQIEQRGTTAVGLEASAQMIGLGRWVHPESSAAMVRGIAETLPYRDQAFTRVICQGALDHFADPPAFMREAARVTSPGGRVAIALANFDSVSCRLGRTVDRVRWRLGAKRPPWRRYWEVPEDHNVKGTVVYVRALGGDALQLERLYGISLLWNFFGYGSLLDRLPQAAADRVLRAMDRAARRRPRHADMIIAVWRKPGAGDAA